MKKLNLLLAACAMLLVFGACGNGQSKMGNEGATDTPTATPSTDLAFFHLQGPVKSCDGVEFDDHGNWIRCKITYNDVTGDVYYDDELTRSIKYYE